MLLADSSERQSMLLGCLPTNAPTAPCVQQPPTHYCFPTPHRHGTPQAGAGFYAGRIPERWLPGRFDVWLHGHQIFHVLIVVAAFVHYRAVMLLLHWRDASGGCAAHGGVGPAVGDVAAAAGEGPHDILHIDEVGRSCAEGPGVRSTAGGGVSRAQDAHGEPSMYVAIQQLARHWMHTGNPGTDTAARSLWSLAGRCAPAVWRGCLNPTGNLLPVCRPHELRNRCT